MSVKKTINNTQRKQFAKLAEEILDKKVQKAEAKLKKSKAEATEDVKKELGVDDMLEKIKSLQKQIDKLDKQKESLGFTSCWDGTAVKEGSKADKLINSKVETETETVENLIEKKREYSAKIWASQDIDEAKSFLDEVKGL